MKNKILFILFIIFFMTSCSSLNNKNINWKKINKKDIFLNLQAGDILIKEKKFSMLGLFGHSAIMKSERLVLDYPKLGKSSYEVDINFWLEKNRDILILRYKNMNENFKNKLIENIEKYSNKKYKIVFNKKSDDYFYCSQFIWFVYYKTAKELGFNLDLDSNKGILVLPYDFINSDFLNTVY